MSNDPQNNKAPDPLKLHNSDIELMKERFVRLLLGEDMTGCGQGVSSALALSNAITNLAASVFGKQNKLVPVPEDKKRKWRKEIEWLLSVTDYIVEFVPSQQIGKDGSNMEIMVTQQRRDLLMNIPALKKLDAMLIDCLDNFKDQKEFWYVPEDADESIERWWIPRVKVPPGGLSDESRRWIQHQKDTCNQVLKASMAINTQVLSEMEVPETYIDTLPKNGKTSLGDSIYKSITDELFDPGQFLSTMDLSSEQNVMDLMNKMEASIVIWKRKMNYKELKSSWSSSVSSEKREVFEERAETILLLIKHKYPALAQSSLDVSKIEHNKDVGQSILESFSRVLESLANTVMRLIEDVLKADEEAQNLSLGTIKKNQSIDSMLTQNPSSGMGKKNQSLDSMLAIPLHMHTLGKLLDRSPSIQSPRGTHMLPDSKGWGVDHGELMEENGNSSPNLKIKHVKILTKAKMSYIEKLEAYGLRSPTARH